MNLYIDIFVYLHIYICIHNSYIYTYYTPGLVAKSVEGGHHMQEIDSLVPGRIKSMTKLIKVKNFVS